ncbi:DUF6550 family protein [Desulfitibacter alkalitolerans]|uniref:DUF6550 family protein n=1 Tax=Desulfitibacter alkalitolerans TaxID=264641 RepID=UPI000486CA42|nr:DUF6550 family protein [Desulfitibacter alkalitolerans]
MKRLNINTRKNIVVSLLLLSVIVMGGLLISPFIEKDNNEDINVAIADNGELQIKIEENEINGIEGPSEVEGPIIDEKESTINPNTNTDSSKKKEEVVIPEPPKEKPESKDDITDKNKVPIYEEKEVKPSAQPETPKGDERNNKGQIYIPGFGWVDDKGGGGEGHIVDSEGDINKQIGNMN